MTPRPGPIEAETFDALRTRIRTRYDAMSPHLQRLARLSLEDPNAFALRTIAALASDVQVQPSALIRFAKALGFEGFSALQQVFRLRLIEGAATYRERVYDTHPDPAPGATDPTRALAECVDDMVQSLRRLEATATPEALAAAVALLHGASHIHIAGLRRSRPVAGYLAYCLARVERPCSLLDFDGGMAGQQVANMRPDDVLAAIAFTEYSPPVIDAVKDAHLRGIRVLAITDLPTSPLARHSTCCFLFDDAPTAPLRPISGPIALVQTLATLLAQTPNPAL